jgi:hypothetical protein
MKTKNSFFMSLTLAFLISPLFTFSQEKRIKPPRKKSRIIKVDSFVIKTFDLYNKVFIYDSLTQAGGEIPAKLEDELMERAEMDVDYLLDLAPEALDDISDASVLKQAKATVNLNKAKKALNYCVKFVKTYLSE